MKKIVLSIGHNWHGGDQWATGHGTTEAVETTKIADAIIAKNIKNFQFVKTPKYLGIYERAKWTNEQNADLIIDLHLDSASPQATGITTFFKNGKNHEKNISENFGKIFAEKMEFRNRGAKPDTTTRHGQLGILRNAKIPAILLELGFISNMSDIEKIHKNGVDAILAGIEEIFWEKILFDNFEQMETNHDYIKILADEMAENPEYEPQYKEHDQRKAEIEIGLLRFWKKYLIAIRKADCIK